MRMMAVVLREVLIDLMGTPMIAVGAFLEKPVKRGTVEKNICFFERRCWPSD